MCVEYESITISDVHNDVYRTVMYIVYNNCVRKSELSAPPVVWIYVLKCVATRGGVPNKAA